MRDKDRTPKLAPPQLTSEPSNMSAASPTNAHSSIAKEEAAKSRGAGSSSHQRLESEAMCRAQSASGAPDYFSSFGNPSSTSSLGRASSMSSDHPWNSLLSEASNGQRTSVPQDDGGPKGGVGMSASLSLSGTPFKLPTAGMRARPSGSNSSTMTNGPSGNTEDLARYEPIEAVDLALSLLKTSSTLVIDIRPSTSFAASRIRGSVNLCAPSTLLKRSGVTVDRIEEEMLSNERDQALFSGWRYGPQKDGIKPKEARNGIKPVERIVVLDTDTAHAGDAGKSSAGGGGHCLIGLLRKFEMAGYAGRLFWLVGGFSSFSSKVEMKDEPEGIANLLDVTLLDEKQETDMPKGPTSSLKRVESQRRSSAPVSQSGPFPLRPSQSADQRKHSLVQPRGLPMEAFSLNSTTRRTSLGGNPRVMQNSTSHPTLNVDGLSAAGEVGGAACANPFFDNIRQNRELQHGITERIPLDLPPLSASDLDLLPAFLRTIVGMDKEDRAEVLARKFFEIEKAEQRRLIATMQQHAAESNLNGSNANERSKPPNKPTASLDVLQLSSPFSSVDVGQNCDNSKETFPFSIAAALERGSENRYNNIWTYEHSRVRCASASDYLNGSYVEPGKEFGCKRRYIATQAPLPSTFPMFWNVVWQQNVRTICMITREFESGRIQSHNYWEEASFEGGLKIRVAEEVRLDAAGGVVDRIEAPKTKASEGVLLFPTMGAKEASGGGGEGGSASVHTIKRRLVLSRAGEERELIHLQFVAWPDYSIPDDAQGILNFMRLANRAQRKASVDIERATFKRRGVGPLVVHCSAGVGRTGTYIVIDSVLDVLRKSQRGQGGQSEMGVWDDGSPDTPDDDVTMATSSVRTKGDDQTVLTTSRQQPRKSLKRELSPSAMDLDTSESDRRPTLVKDSNGSAIVGSHGTSGRQDVSSPPPMRRSKSDEADQENGALSLSALSSPVNPSPAGTETPSGAMGNMHIAWDNLQQTPTKSRLGRASQMASNNGDGLSSPVGSQADLAPMMLDGGKDGKGQEAQTVDMIQRAVETIREQRMSTVQTTRQFVFAYQAVVEGLLRRGREKLPV